MTPDDARELRDRLFGGGSFSTVGIERSRSILAELRPPGGAEIASVVDMVVPAEPAVPVRLYHPVPGATLPVLVWVHGGGWCIGDLDTSDRICRSLSALTEHLVVSVDYRLAPEHPFPQALEDVVAVIRWVVNCVHEVGGDGSRLTLAGESAGANLVIAACLMGRPDLPAAHEVLVVPVADLATDWPSMVADPDPAMPVRDLVWFGEQYLPDAAACDNPLVAPLRADSLAGLPPATVVTAGADPLHDGGCELVRALRQDGVPVVHLDYDGARHGFFAAPGDAAGERALADVVAAVRRSAGGR